MNEPTQVNKPPQDSSHSWSVFFTVFFAQLVAFLIGLFGMQFSDFGVFVSFGLVPLITFILGVVKISNDNSRIGKSLLANAIIAPLAFLIIGAGTCFLIFSQMSH